MKSFLTSTIYGSLVSRYCRIAHVLKHGLSGAYELCIHGNSGLTCDRHYTNLLSAILKTILKKKISLYSGEEITQKCEVELRMHYIDY